MTSSILQPTSSKFCFVSRNLSIELVLLCNCFRAMSATRKDEGRIGLARGGLIGLVGS